MESLPGTRVRITNHEARANAARSKPIAVMTVADMQKLPLSGLR
jgi:hypothetical protein